MITLTFLLSSKLLHNNSKINVLVIPDLFPKFEGDLQGIFILDYLKATAPFCTNTVLFLKLHGSKKGVLNETIHSANVFKIFQSSSKSSLFLKPFYYLALFYRGYKLGKQFKDIQIIHSHGTILSGTLSFLLSKKLKVPFVITEHQGPFSVISGVIWKKMWAKYILERANKVLVVSEHLKKEILSCGIKPRSIEVSYNPVDTDLFALRRTDTNKKIVFVGRLDNFKGAFRCLMAFEQLYFHYPEWNFTIVGDGEDMINIKRFLKEHSDLTKRVETTGSLQKTEISKVLADASFFVFPSLHESFGLVIAESLSCGVPVITSNVTAPMELVNENNGLLVTPDSLEDIRSKMEIMITSHEKYNSQLIRQEVIQKFSIANFGESLLKTYKTLLNQYI